MQSFKMAIRSIASNKLRSFLTMLGIIIGVASVIILVSLVTGYMNSMINSFNDMGVDQIDVTVTNTPSRSLEPEDMYAFYEEHRDEFRAMTPSVSMSAKIKSGDSTLNYTNIGGYSEDYLSMKGYKLAAGRNISYADLAGSRNTALLGYYPAWYMFGSPKAAVNQKIKLNGSIFTVVGVVERQDQEMLTEGGADDFLWMPYTSAAKLNQQRKIDSYIMAVRDTDKAAECTTLIEDYLQDIFKSSDLFFVYANSSMLKELNNMIKQMSLMLGGIAGISLLVAGIGVMNIMLVSVTERTREIGIRKALGAKQRAILTQFIIEAAVTSTIGGLIGIGVGAVFTAAISSFVGFKATPTFGAVLISFSVSVGVGLLFGYMPAKRAAKLNPIDALRSE
ncbi:MAG: ABC transporter permease [Eubacteriales bacterium]|nr:ABC transporter permease [Eubacteriales bacterium]